MLFLPLPNLEEIIKGRREYFIRREGINLSLKREVVLDLNVLIRGLEERRLPSIVRYEIEIIWIPRSLMVLDENFFPQLLGINTIFCNIARRLGIKIESIYAAVRRLGIQRKVRYVEPYPQTIGYLHKNYGIEYEDAGYLDIAFRKTVPVLTFDKCLIFQTCKHKELPPALDPSRLATIYRRWKELFGIRDIPFLRLEQAS